MVLTGQRRTGDLVLNCGMQGQSSAGGPDPLHAVPDGAVGGAEPAGGVPEQAGGLTGEPGPSAGWTGPVLVRPEDSVAELRDDVGGGAAEQRQPVPHRLLRCAAAYAHGRTATEHRRRTRQACGLADGLGRPGRDPDPVESVHDAWSSD